MLNVFALAKSQKLTNTDDLDFYVTKPVVVGHRT